MPSTRTKHRLIIAFCLFHMAAVGAYLMPSGMFAIVDIVYVTTRPYVLLTSQWQKWDIFSPNPIRRVSTYRIERDAGDRWETARVFSFDSLPLWHRAKELKVLSRLEAKDGNWNMLVEPYLRSLCGSIEKSEGMRLRLVADTVVLPAELSALSRVSENTVPPFPTILGSASCPRMQ
jgi:hypothetical protein